MTRHRQQSDWQPFAELMSLTLNIACKRRVSTSRDMNPYHPQHNVRARAPEERFPTLGSLRGLL